MKIKIRKKSKRKSKSRSRIGTLTRSHLPPLHARTIPMFATTLRILPLLGLLLLPNLAPAQDVRGAKEDAASLEDWLPQAAAKDAPGDGELKKLLKARYREAVAEVKSARAVYEQGVGQGRSPLDDMLQAASRVKKSALELCSTSAEKVAVLQQQVKFCKDVETAVAERYDQGIDPASSLHRARYARLSAEIELVRGKKEGEKAK